MAKSNSLAIVILAAGKSSRLGEPKQLLKIEDETLIELAVKKALYLSDDVSVILGAYSSLCLEKIKDLEVKHYVNEEYETGMASSLKLGVSTVSENKDVLIMLCDMPLVPLSHYEKLVELYLKNKVMIVCSKYNDNFFVPAIFPNRYFDSFKKLEGDKGARKILQQNEKEYVLLDNNYALDVDTKKDFDEVLATKSC